MRNIDALRKQIAELEDASNPPACRCIVEHYRGDPKPPELEWCDKCGLARRGEHTVVELVVVRSRDEAVAALAEVERIAPAARCGA